MSLILIHLCTLKVKVDLCTEGFWKGVLRGRGTHWLGAAKDAMPLAYCHEVFVF